MFAQFYGLSTREANQRIEALLKIVGLADRMHTKSSDLSTGLRQKMNIVRGFLTDPEVLFLDEPTLGLDVGATRDVHHFVLEWLAADPTRTLLLTTHSMIEADELCDRVAIINQGRVLACDQPSALKRRLQKQAHFEIATSPLAGVSLEALGHQTGVHKVASRNMDGSATLDVVLNEEAALAGVMNTLTRAQVRIDRLTKHELTLEDVFVDLVGRSIEEMEEEQTGEPSNGPEPASF